MICTQNTNERKWKPGKAVIVPPEEEKKRRSRCIGKRLRLRAKAAEKRL